VFLYDSVGRGARRGGTWLSAICAARVRTGTKALLDGERRSAEGALDSALRLAVAQSGVIADLLGHVLANVRPACAATSSRPWARLARPSPPAVLPALVRALKQGDGSTRGACARGPVCRAIKESSPPRLPTCAWPPRPNREVRTEAASWPLQSTEGGIPKGAARMPSRLTSSDEQTVRRCCCLAGRRWPDGSTRSCSGPSSNLLEDPERARARGSRRSAHCLSKTGSTWEPASPISTEAVDLLPARGSRRAARSRCAWPRVPA